MKKADILVLLFFLTFLPIFLWHLGAFGLADFDEGWYAEIARNILINKNPYLLTFNGGPYYDHPFLGFMLMAVSFMIFGINESAARFPSAILGFSTLIVTYLIGRKLFHWSVGLSAAMILLSSVWFVFRARSGNLDTVFLFFLVTTFYLSLKAKEGRRWLALCGLSLAAVLLVKSMIGLVVTVPLILVFWSYRKKFNKYDLLVFLSAFLALIGPWLLVMYLGSGWYFLKVMINIGTRNGPVKIPNIFQLGSSQTFSYLHWGIRKWYYPGVVATLASAGLMFRQQKIAPVVAIVVVLLISFITKDPQVQIWHLIPLYPFLALLIAFVLWRLTNYLKIPPGVAAGAVILVAMIQIYGFRNEIKLSDFGLNDWAMVASAARGRPQQLYLDGPDLLPTTVFYSRKSVILAHFQKPPQNSLVGVINYAPKPFLLITEQWRLEMDKINPAVYQPLAQSGGKLLLLVQNEN